MASLRLKSAVIAPASVSRSPISRRTASRSRLLTRSKNWPVDFLHDFLDVELQRGRISEASRAIDLDEVPRRIEEPIPGVGIDVAHEGVEHLRSMQLAIPPRRVGITDTLFLDVAEHLHIFHPKLGGRLLAFIL